MSLGACDDAEQRRPDAGAADVDDAGIAPECVAETRRPCPTGCPEAWQPCVDGRWSDCEAPVEVCNGVDDDCDGEVDEGLVEDCVTGVSRCVAGEWTRCSISAPVADEVCDGQDQDQDGQIDEAPIITARGSLPAPGGDAPSALFWQGETWALVLPAFPNWLISLSIEGPTVWGSQRFGERKTPAAGGWHREGIALAWRMADRRLAYTLVAESGGPIRAAGPVADFETASLPSVDTQEQEIAIAWAQGGKANAALLDPATGEVLAHTELGPAVTAQIVSVREDGYAIAYRSFRGDGAIARLSGQVGLVAGPIELGAVDDLVANGNPYREQLLAVWLAEGQVRWSRYDRALAPLGEVGVLAEGQANASGLTVIRNENEYAIFWAAGARPEDRHLWGALIDADGQTLAEPIAIVGPAESFQVGRAGNDYAVVYTDHTRLHLLSTPLRCRPSLDP